MTEAKTKSKPDLQITKVKTLLAALGFMPEDGFVSNWKKIYSHHNNYKICVNLDEQRIEYGSSITLGDKTTCNFKASENFVVLECINRLLEKGYSPENITIEKTWATGHNTSGKLDILVSHSDKNSAYLMIECKSHGTEFEKERKRLFKNGGQLFTYFQQDRNAEILMLYSSKVDGKGKLEYCNEIIKIEDDYRQTGNVKDFFDRWNKLTKNNGVFDTWVKPYNFQSKALTLKNLKEIKQEDSGFIFNQFLEILRHNVVSDKPNAFNKIFTLFLCKIYDEKITKHNEELAFQWFCGSYQYEGKTYPPDNNISFQKRLTDLYKKGMNEFLDKKVTDISDADFERKYGNQVSVKIKQAILNEIVEIRLKKNNEFAIKEVFDTSSFEENAKVVKEIVELLQSYKLRYVKKQQYLSDFFEMLLTTGLKQESGQFFTPVPIAQFIIKSIPFDKIVQDKLNSGEKDNLLPTIIDYASGSGHFITESMYEMQNIINAIDSEDYTEDTTKKIKAWKEDHFDWAFKYIYGIEKDYRLVKVGKVGCYLHGDGLAQILHSDGLGSFSKTVEYKGLLKKVDKEFSKENKQFDIVISNPPYSISSFKNNARKYYTEEDFEIYKYLTDQSSEIECLFIERTKQLLKDGGIAGIILPSSILSNTGIYTKAREIILQYFEIIAIAKLGSNTFMATGTNTVILFLRRRDNYKYKNIEIQINNVFSNHKDITIHKIETPISKYLKYVWKEIKFSDYITLLNTIPNHAICNHEIYKEYKKKIKIKDEKSFWSSVISLEKEKILYFILTFPQRIVLMKTGEKNDEKQFLGYEFSNRRGNEGIHPIQSDTTIDKCTKLFDPDIFDNPEKASTYIYHAFQDNFDSKISDNLKNNITIVDLVDMLTFDHASFEKNISLSIKTKKQIESKWKLIKIGDVAEIRIGGTPSRNKKEYYIGGTNLWVSISEMNGQVIQDTKEKINQLGVENSNVKLIPKDTLLLSFKLSIGKVAIAGKDLYTNEAIAGLILKDITTNKKILNSYLFSLFKNKYIDLEVANQKIFGSSLNSKTLKNIEIPLPPLEVQQKIISEIEKLEAYEMKTKKQIEALNTNITNLIVDETFETKQLNQVVSKQSEILDPTKKIGDVFCIGLENIESNTGKLVGNPLTQYYTIKSNKNIYKKGDLLYGKLRPNLNKLYLAQQDGICSTDILVFRCHDAELNKFYAYYLRTKKFNSEVLKTVSGQQLPRTKWSAIESIKVPIPKDKEKITKQINSIEKQILDLQKKLAEIPLQKEAIFFKNEIFKETI